jgi:ABC-type methionine transport system permease subunit
MNEIGFILVWLFAFAIGVWLYIILPAQMAGKRNRSQVIWVLISLVGSPFLAILLLLALGNAPETKDVAD